MLKLNAFLKEKNADFPSKEINQKFRVGTE